MIKNLFLIVAKFDEIPIIHHFHNITNENCKISIEYDLFKLSIKNSFNCINESTLNTVKKTIIDNQKLDQDYIDFSYELIKPKTIDFTPIFKEENITIYLEQPFQEYNSYTFEMENKSAIELMKGVNVDDI